MNFRLGLMLSVVVLVEALALHAVMGLGLPAILSGDGHGYHQLAVNLIDHHRFSLDRSPPYRPNVFRAPGYPAFIAVTYLVGGRSYATLRIAQLSLLVITAWLPFHAASGYVSRRASTAAAFLCATYPPFVIMAMAHLTEPLTTFLVVLFVLVLTKGMNDPRMGSLAMGLAGLVLAVGSLVRPTLSLLFIPAIGGVLLLEPALLVPRRMALSGLVVVGLLIGSLPWCVRNLALTGEFIPYAASGKGYSLFLSALQYGGRLSHRLRGPDWHFAEEEFHRCYRMSGRPYPGISRADHPDAINDSRLLLERDDLYRDMAMRVLRALTPRQLIRGLVVRLGFLWIATDFTNWEPGLFHLLAQAWHDILLAMALLGCWMCRGHLPRHWPLWLVPAYLTAIHLVFHVECRYTDPARPFFLIYAGVGLSHLSATLWQETDRPAIGPGLGDDPSA